MKTVFTFKNGKTRVMGQRYADVLGKLGKGTYETRELRASDPAFPGTPDIRTIAEVDAQIRPTMPRLPPSRKRKRLRRRIRKLSQTSLMAFRWKNCASLRTIAA